MLKTVVRAAVAGRRHRMSEGRPARFSWAKKFDQLERSTTTRYRVWKISGTLRARDQAVLDELGATVVQPVTVPHLDVVDRAIMRRWPCNSKGDGYRVTVAASSVATAVVDDEISPRSLTTGWRPTGSSARVVVASRATCAGRTPDVSLSAPTALCTKACMVNASPHIVEPDLDLPHHQEPFGRSLCLIGRSTRYWDSSDSLAELLDTQLAKALAAGADPAGNHDELDQAEPLASYYKHDDGIEFLIDSAIADLPPEARGTLTVKVHGHPPPQKRLR